MEQTSVASMNLEDEDEGIPESTHSSLSSSTSDGQCTPTNYEVPSTYVRGYSDTDSAFDDTDFQQSLFSDSSHVLFYFFKSQRVSYENICKWLQLNLPQLRSKRKNINSGFILKSLEKGGK